jgi:hypothetical protein
MSHHGSRVQEIFQTAAQFRDREAVIRLLQLFRAHPFLQAKQLDTRQAG